MSCFLKQYHSNSSTEGSMLNPRVVVIISKAHRIGITVLVERRIQFNNFCVAWHIPGPSSVMDHRLRCRTQHRMGKSGKLLAKV